MTIEHFVILARRPKEVGADIYVICAESAKQAHQLAVNQYRKKAKLSVNIHIETLTLERYNTEAEASSFMDKLQLKLDEEKLESK